jgi:hypothetical protein
MIILNKKASYQRFLWSFATAKLHTKKRLTAKGCIKLYNLTISIRNLLYL